MLKKTFAKCPRQRGCAGTLEQGQGRGPPNPTHTPQSPCHFPVSSAFSGGLYFIAGHQPNPTGNRTPLLSLLEARPVMLESLLARAAPFPVPLRLPAFFGPIVHYVGVPWGDIGNWFPQSSPRKLVSSAPGPRQLCCIINKFSS